MIYQYTIVVATTEISANEVLSAALASAKTLARSIKRTLCIHSRKVIIKNLLKFTFSWISQEIFNFSAFGALHMI